MTRIDGMTPIDWLADHIARYYPGCIRRYARRVRARRTSRPGVKSAKVADARQLLLWGVG